MFDEDPPLTAEAHWAEIATGARDNKIKLKFSSFLIIGKRFIVRNTKIVHYRSLRSGNQTLTNDEAQKKGCFDLKQPF